MFKQAIRGAGVPKYVSSDHDPLYRFHQWQANLRILDISEIKTVPYVPLSYPFIERLIGTIRRECLDQFLFWTATDLELKLTAFTEFYNKYRTHTGLEGRTPIEPSESEGTDLKSYRWQKHLPCAVPNTNCSMSTNSPGTGYPYQFVFSEAVGHVDRNVERQTMPEAFEWVWKGYKPAGK